MGATLIGVRLSSADSLPHKGEGRGSPQRLSLNLTPMGATLAAAPFARGRAGRFDKSGHRRGAQPANDRATARGAPAELRVALERLV
jgi:hypothetical protein